VTKEEMPSYLEIEDSEKNKHDALTRLYCSDRHSVFVYFLKKDQTAELMEKIPGVFILWIISPIHLKSGEY
jgi:hypothetical protein